MPGENLSVQRTNKLNPHMTPSPGIEPGSHWWEASALTTAPSLHPNYQDTVSSVFAAFIIQIDPTPARGESKLSAILCILFT